MMHRDSLGAVVEKPTLLLKLADRALIIAGVYVGSRRAGFQGAVVGGMLGATASYFLLQTRS